MHAEGRSQREIARELGISRNTVAKYASKGDFSPEPPVARPRTSPTMEPYARAVRSWLEGDRDRPRRQRHTARRVYDRLVSELGYGGSLATVERFVREWRRENAHGPGEGFLELEWPCGTCQVDYGHASAVVAGEEVELHELAVSWPHSNARFCVMCESERGECLVDGLMTVFDHVGGVPPEAVLDNATEAGRRIAGVVRESSLFSAFRAHTGMRTKYCNPHSGHEKGSVEAKVRYLRSNLFVPVPRVTSMDAYNAKLPAMCMGLCKDHYIKGEPEGQLFMEDRLAMAGLPPKPFEAVRYERPTADKQGKVKLDGRHSYSTDPSLAGCELIAALGATKVTVYTASGEFVCEHERAYGAGPTDTCDPASQLAVLAVKAGGWVNSRVRFAVPDDLREHMDSLPKPDLRAELRMMRDQCALTGWDATVAAMEAALAATGRIDAASVSVAAARIAGGSIVYDEPVDLSEYDRMAGIGEVA